MQVVTAKTAGFCFGVRRAVETCYEQASNANGKVYTYGPIIHNEMVVKDLEARGIGVIHSKEELARLDSGTVIIRSHGVTKEICDLIEEKGLRLVDATCPFVKKIHKIVREKSEEGYQIIVIGSRDHPEVEGICGWSLTPVTVIEDEQQASAFVRDGDKPLCIVSQTTFNSKKFDKLVEILQLLRYDRDCILNTICNATEERQKEAAELAGKADVMIVIGGKNSSNTQKLFEICKEKCSQTYYIQTLADLDLSLLPSVGYVGITAGASTPNNLIEEVSKQCQK